MRKGVWMEKERSKGGGGVDYGWRGKEYGREKAEI